MKALLIKDFLVIYRQQLKIFIVSAVFLSFTLNQVSAAFILAIGAMMPISAVAYDQQSNWYDLCGALPLTATKIVLSKYILGAISIGFFATTMALLHFIATSIGIAQNIDNFFNVALLGVLLAVLVVCLYLPFIIKFGSEKGRVLIFLFMGGFGVLLGMIPELRLPSISFGLILLFAVFVVLSIFLSIKIYKQKHG